MEYVYKPTKIVAAYFDESHVPYRVVNSNNQEEIHVEHKVSSGPGLKARYISRDNDNDIAVREILVYDIPENKRICVLEACNRINAICRHICVYLDSDSKVVLRYDFPCSISDDSLGKASLEMLCDIDVIIDTNYSILMRAIYSDFSEADEQEDDEINRFLKKIDMTINAWNDDISATSDVDDE